MQKLKKLLHKKNLLNSYNVVLFVIFSFAFFIRFYQLGYSNFYGDETKVLYIDKTVPAYEFFMNQRKGPVQFLVAWVMEKVTGGYSEFWIRLPFAIASFASVLVFYILIRRLFDKKVALASTLFYSLSGFSIAFARTAQYQSFLVLFGFLALYFLHQSLTLRNSKLIVLAAVFLAVAFYSHYDAVFYLIPCVYLLFSEQNLQNKEFKQNVLMFFVPLTTLLALFYVPYLIQGYFKTATLGYLSRRFSAEGSTLINSSFYTYWVYNPIFVSILPLVIAPFIFAKRSLKNIRLLLFWFAVPFLFFELVFLDSGTHIQHYFVPLYIIAACVLVEIYNRLQILQPKLQNLYVAVLTIVFAYLAYGLSLIYIPIFRTNYPWNPARKALFSFAKPSSQYHLFLYGFPYNQGWVLVREYMLSLNGVRGFYTNDDDDVAQYYLKEIAYTKPGSEFIPMYYVYFLNDSQFGAKNVGFAQIQTNYTAIKSFYVDNELTSIVYKRN